MIYPGTDVPGFSLALLRNFKQFCPLPAVAPRLTHGTVIYPGTDVPGFSLALLRNFKQFCPLPAVAPRLTHDAVIYPGTDVPGFSLALLRNYKRRGFVTRWRQQCTTGSESATSVARFWGQRERGKAGESPRE